VFNKRGEEVKMIDSARRGVKPRGKRKLLGFP